LILQGFGEAFGGAEVVEELPEFGKRPEGGALVEAEIDGLGKRVGRGGELLESVQGLLIEGQGLLIGGAPEGLPSCLP
jgi:hypothetical protein